MNGSAIALDTNAAIRLLNDSGGAPTWLAEYRTVCLPLPVVAELTYGALKSQRIEQNLDRIYFLVSRSHVLEMDLETANVYGKVRLTLKLAARPIPENDVWIAASCIQHALPLATNEEHFKAVDGLALVASP